MHRFYWYRFVQISVNAYFDKRLDLNSEQGITAYRAVKDAVTETGGLRDGADRQRMIAMVYGKKTHTRSGAAMRIHVSERTCERWDNEFVYMVAKKMGFWG